MKCLLCFASLFCCTLIYSQQTDTIMDGNHFNYIRRFHNGVVAEIGNYPPGDTIRNGPWYFYYGNGKPYLHGSYKKNERFGKWEYYDLHGALHIEKMENGLMNGSRLPDPFDSPVFDNFATLLSAMLHIWETFMPKQ